LLLTGQNRHGPPLALTERTDASHWDRRYFLQIDN
jgi:hypothetical protein